MRIPLAFDQLRGPAGGLGNIARAFAQRNYRIYATGNGISLIGWWLQRVAVGWLAWTLTHSGTWLGLVYASLHKGIGALMSCGFWLLTRLRHKDIAAALEDMPAAARDALAAPLPAERGM